MKKMYFLFFLTIFIHNYLISSAPASASSGAPSADFKKNKIIVVLRDTEEIVSHTKPHPLYNVRTPHQQVLLFCSNSVLLNHIKQKIDPKGRIKPEEQIKLQDIIDPVLVNISHRLKTGETVRPSAFEVDLTTKEVKSLDLSWQVGGVVYKTFLLETDPVSQKWFGDKDDAVNLTADGKALQ